MAKAGRAANHDLGASESPSRWGRYPTWTPDYCSHSLWEQCVSRAKVSLLSAIGPTLGAMGSRATTARAHVARPAHERALDALARRLEQLDLVDIEDPATFVGWALIVTHWPTVGPEKP
jgi:hypothetical protein